MWLQTAFFAHSNLLLSLHLVSLPPFPPKYLWKLVYRLSTRCSTHVHFIAILYRYFSTPRSMNSTLLPLHVPFFESSVLFCDCSDLVFHVTPLAHYRFELGSSKCCFVKNPNWKFAFAFGEELQMNILIHWYFSCPKVPRKILNFLSFSISLNF